MKNLILLTLSIIVVQTSINAQILSFSKITKTPRYDDVRSMVAGNDGCFYYTGLNKNGADTAGDMYLAKVNAAGSLLWEKSYGYPKEDGGNFLLKTKDDGLLIVGHTNDAPDDECDGYLVKTDKDGNKIWSLFVDTVLDEVCSGAIEATDGSWQGRRNAMDTSF